MGFFSNIKSKLFGEGRKVSVERLGVYLPIQGQVIPIAEIADGVFSEGMMGKGCGIIPSEGVVVAPFDGKVIQVSSTKHALIVQSDAGIQVIIHVGMDTVKMKGQGFEPKVKEGDQIKYGQVMMNFSLEEIEKAGYPSTTALIVINTDEYKDVVCVQEGNAERGQKVLQVVEA